MINWFVKLDGKFYKGKSVSPNIICLNAICLKMIFFLFSKGLKFIPAPKQINKALIK